MNEIPNYRNRRGERIKDLTPNLLSGFLYSNPQEAIASTKKLLEKVSTPIMFDIDDTLLYSEPWLRARLNAFFLKENPDFEQVSLEDLINAGGRYFQVPKFQEEAKRLNRPFPKIWQQLDSDTEPYSFMRPTQSRIQMVSDFTNAEFKIIGYPTARPNLLMKITAQSLFYFGFPQAPVIDTKASSANPSEAKVKFFKDLLAELTLQKPIIFIDDHIETALEIQKQLERSVIPIVPIVPRNRNMIKTLRQYNVLHGPPTQLCRLAIERLS